LVLLPTVKNLRGEFQGAAQHVPRTEYPSAAHWVHTKYWLRLVSVQDNEIQCVAHWNSVQFIAFSGPVSMCAHGYSVFSTMNGTPSDITQMTME